jgi:protein-S-isoprenylcysteine O-methyltransferase Ste14
MRISLQAVLATLISALIQFGIAIALWGGPAAFFAHRAFIVLAAVTLAMMAVAPLSQGNLNPGQQEDRSNRWVLLAFSLIALGTAILPAYCDRHGILTLDGDATRWAGVALYTAGGVLRLWPVFVLGKRFSGLVAIQEGHTLETGNIYRYVRNPSYLGMVVILVGWALVFRSLLGLVFSLLLWVPLGFRIAAEERLLRAHFGAEYETYCARTPRLIPWLW